MSHIRSRRFNASTGFSLLAFFCCAISPLALAVAPTPSEALAALADHFIETRLDLNPLMGTWITGDVRYEDKFVNDLTPAFRAQERALFTDTLKALKKIDVRSFSESDQLTRAVLEYQAVIGLDSTKYDFYLTPINQFYSMPLTLVQLAST